MHDEIRRIIEGYVGARDRLSARHKILDVRQKEMIAVQVEHQRLLEAQFPDWPLALWEGLNELTGLVRGQKAQRLAQFNKH